MGDAERKMEEADIVEWIDDDGRTDGRTDGLHMRSALERKEGKLVRGRPIMPRPRASEAMENHNGN